MKGRIIPVVMLLVTTMPAGFLGEIFTPRLGWGFTSVGFLYNSYNTGYVVNVPNYHEKTTKKAIDNVASFACTFTEEAKQKVVEANLNQDLREMIITISSESPYVTGKPIVTDANCGIITPCPYRWMHHFDRYESYSENSVANQRTFEDGAKYLRQKKKIITERLQGGSTLSALIALGRGLHALQDFFSHSNFVEPRAYWPPNIWEVLPTLLGEPGDLIPVFNVQFTRYDYRQDSAGNAEHPSLEPYSHKGYAKDWPQKNFASTEIMLGPFTSFDLAEKAATDASTEFIKAVLGIGKSSNYCGTVANWQAGASEVEYSDQDEPGKGGISLPPATPPVAPSSLILQ